MYGFTNADGEPIMDGAAYRFEQMLDSQYSPDPDSIYDRWDDDTEPEQIDPKVCAHDGDKGYPMGAGMSCEGCWETYQGPQMIRFVAGSIEFPAFMSSDAK